LNMPPGKPSQVLVAGRGVRQRGGDGVRDSHGAVGYRNLTGRVEYRTRPCREGCGGAILSREGR
jgi:hypothetical protein